MIVVDALHGVASLSTATLLNWEGTRLILDAGPGTMTEIWRRRLRLRGLAAILISHGHLDHAYGLADLLWFLDNRGWDAPLQIIHPPAATSTVEGLVRIGGSPSFVRLTPLSPGAPGLEIGRLTVQAFAVNHPIPANGYVMAEPAQPGLETTRLIADGIPQNLWPALAQGRSVEFQNRPVHAQDYLVQRRQRRVVYTGDTGPLAELAEIVHDADLLIADATWIQPQWPNPGEAPHLTLRQILEIAQVARVRRLLLTHLTSRVPYSDYQKEIALLQREMQITIPVLLPLEARIEIP
jgi:ribonuclease Z